jgi:hypothetical protein
VTGLDDTARAIHPEPLLVALERVVNAPLALLGLGIPRCPATQMLPASLGAIVGERPGLPVALGILSTSQDWAARETDLWPRDIRISRSVVPVLFVMRDGRAVATRHGGASARVIDEWLAVEARLPPSRLPDAWVDDEARELGLMAARRAQHAAVNGRRSVD